METSNIGAKSSDETPSNADGPVSETEAEQADYEAGNNNETTTEESVDEMDDENSVRDDEFSEAISEDDKPIPNENLEELESQEED